MRLALRNQRVAKATHTSDDSRHFEPVSYGGALVEKSGLKNKH